MSLLDWGVACLILFGMLGCWGLIWRRGWRVLAGAGLLCGADFVRGLVYRGGGESPGWGWGSLSVSEPAPVLWLLAVLYCSWGLYPFVLVGSGAALRTFAGCASIIVLAGLVAAVFPIEPPWMQQGVSRAVDAVPFVRDVVASDVSPEAAFPSVHVAVPLVVAVFERSWAWAWYTVVTSVVVVLSGEHWTVDVGGGVVVALAVVGCVRIAGSWGGRARIVGGVLLGRS